MNLARSSAPIVLLSCLSLGFSLPARAAIDETVPDAPTLERLELRAQQAPPRDQCFLYSELVHTFSEIAGKDLLAGNAAAAKAALKKVQQYAQLIHLGLSHDPKKLKNSEQLMEHTAFRLHEYARSASPEDRGDVKDALSQLNELEDELLVQVFKH